MNVCKDIIDSICQFTHLAQIEHAGFHQLGILAELSIADAVTVVQNLVGVSDELLYNDFISHKQLPRCVESLGQ